MRGSRLPIGQRRIPFPSQSRYGCVGSPLAEGSSMASVGLGEFLGQRRARRAPAPATLLVASRFQWLLAVLTLALLLAHVPLVEREFPLLVVVVMFLVWLGVRPLLSLQWEDRVTSRWFQIFVAGAAVVIVTALLFLLAQDGSTSL